MSTIISPLNSQTILELIDHIKEANCIKDLRSFLRVIPLEEIKAFIRNRVVRLEQNTDSFAAKDELKKLSLSILPITNILPTDNMMQIITYLPKDHRKYLPLLSKDFKNIMYNQTFFSKCTVLIQDPDMKERDPTNQINGPRIRPRNCPCLQSLSISYSPSHEGNITIKPSDCQCKGFFRPRILMKSPKFRSRQLANIKALDSSLPWRNIHHVIIEGCPKVIIQGDWHSNESVSMKHPETVQVLMEMNQITRLELRNFFSQSRLLTYPPFISVINLKLSEIKIGVETKLKACFNSVWFPQLKVLEIPLISSSENLNDMLCGLKLKVLTLVSSSTAVRNSQKYSLTIPDSVKFLCIGAKKRNEMSNISEQIKRLDLSQCNKLIGVKLQSAVAFESIVWNQLQPLLYINVVITIEDKRYDYGNTNHKRKQIMQRWYEAYTNERIPSQYVVGSSFFQENEIDDIPTKAIGQGDNYIYNEQNEHCENSTCKCIRRMSIAFEEISDSIQTMCTDMLHVPTWVKFMSMNYPRVSRT